MTQTVRPTRGETVDLTPGRGTRVGVVLPHFGKDSTWERLFGLAPRLEELGYQSVWVRDHLNFRPHGYEGGTSRFVDPFMTLNAVGMLTKRLILSATIIPYRHPLVVSQLFGSLAAACGDRLLPSLAAGNSPRSFAAVEMPKKDRWEACREAAKILRLTWTQQGVSYHGTMFNFDDVTINPAPRPD
jgi:alkanesulfonate monooxygenase SsuD/methylene tetrahydromethanopterin reductase-like flavin-dependent oxidoreductase (luciferase family)